MALSQYKDVFGKPNEGAHSYRIYDLAVVDLGCTLLTALILAYFTTKKQKPEVVNVSNNNNENNVKKVNKFITKDILKKGGSYFLYLIKNFMIYSIILLFLAIIIHRLFAVNTKINVLIFGEL